MGKKKNKKKEAKPHKIEALALLANFKDRGTRVFVALATIWGSMLAVLQTSQSDLATANLILSSISFSAAIAAALLGIAFFEWTVKSLDLGAIKARTSLEHIAKFMGHALIYLAGGLIFLWTVPTLVIASESLINDLSLLNQLARG